MISTSPSLLPTHRVLAEPLLAFGPQTGAGRATERHPLLGLQRYGPYSRDTFGSASVRIATITTRGMNRRLRDFLSKLRQRHQPSDRRQYVPPFPGFRALLNTDIVPAPPACLVQLDDNIGAGSDPHKSIVGEVAAAIRALATRRAEWDVIVILAPARWRAWERSADGVFSLHDRVKAVAATQGLPTQFLWQDSALTFRLENSLAWRLSIALYAKAGGIPWRIYHDSEQDVAYIGLAYAIRGGTRDAFVTCCSQVFDSDGGGMDFVAYDVGQGLDLENPHLTRDQMRTVMARSVNLYTERHAGRVPRRIVVHKTTRFRDEEADAVLDAWSACEEIECLRIQTSTPWRAVHLVPSDDPTLPSMPRNWPVDRGTVQYLSGRDALLYVNGTAPGLAISGGNFYQGGKSIPRPILISRDAGSGPLELSAGEILALSKMDWNNDALYGQVPVTIEYSSVLAGVISHAPGLLDGVYPYRLFM
jgi:hypothetical protein